GLRIGEALALEWDDLQGNHIRVNKSVSRHRMDDVSVGPPKTKSGNRVVTLPDSAVAMLHQLPRTRQRIFASEHGSVPNSSILRRQLRYLCTKANVPYLGIHGLRHVHASLVVAGGLDVKTLQVRLGHSRPSTTINI